MTRETLERRIVELSQAADFPAAKKEWRLVEISRLEAPDSDTCLCGHNPIREVCELENRTTDKTATVGNCCVKRFLELPSGKIFDALKRIEEDNTKAVNQEALDYARERGWINEQSEA